MNKINVILCEIKSLLQQIGAYLLIKMYFSNSFRRVLPFKAGKQRRATASSAPAFVENKASPLTTELCETFIIHIRGHLKAFPRIVTKFCQLLQR